MQALYAVCERGQKKRVQKERGRRREGRKALSSFSLVISLPVLACFSVLFPLFLFFHANRVGDRIYWGHCFSSYLAFFFSLSFFLPLPCPQQPRINFGGRFCLNYNESGRESSEATFLCLCFFPSLSVRDLYSFPSYPSCRSHLFRTLNLGKAHGEGSLCLMIMIISYPALSTTMDVEPVLRQPIYAAIDLLSLYVLFSEYRSCDNTLEKFLSNFVLFMGICTHNL